MPPTLRLILAGLAAAAVQAEEHSHEGLVDVAPLARVTATSDSKEWGQGPRALVDNDDDTMWHQADNHKWSRGHVDIEFFWDEPHTIREIVTKSPGHSGNYNYHDIKIYYGMRDINGISTYGRFADYSEHACDAGRESHWDLVKGSDWTPGKLVRARYVRLELSYKCGGNHFALSTVKILADPEDESHDHDDHRAVAEAPSVGAVELQKVALVAVPVAMLAAIACGVALMRSGKATQSENSYNTLA